MTIKEKLQEAYEQGRRAEREDLIRLYRAICEGEGYYPPFEAARLIDDDAYRARMMTKYSIKKTEYMF